MIAERGWIDADDLEALTGERREPTLDQAVVSPEWLQATQHDGRGTHRGSRRRRARPGRARRTSARCRERRSTTSRSRRGERGLRAHAIHSTDHPFVAALLAGGVAPPDRPVSTRLELRELVRRKLIVERDGVYFHPATDRHGRRDGRARLLQAHPDGFTVAQLRDDLGASRKYALPLVNELDARGITRRRGDLRVAGPRLPSGGAGSEPA